MTRHNWPVLRGVLLAVVFVWSVWATGAQIVHASPEAASTLAGAGACSELDGPRSTGDSDGEWTAQHQARASVTESVWKSPLVHAGLAGARCPDLFVAIRTPDAPITVRAPHLITRSPSPS